MRKHGKVYVYIATYVDDIFIVAMNQKEITRQLEEANKFKLNDYKICLFGTGHAACTFLNILKLHDLIDLVIDDDRNKQDLILPNSNLKIIDSNQINKMSKILIILGVNSESEKKIILKLKNKLKKEIKFFSIYNKSKYSFSKT